MIHLWLWSKCVFQIIVCNIHVSFWVKILSRYLSPTLKVVHRHKWLWNLLWLLEFSLFAKKSLCWKCHVVIDLINHEISFFELHFFYSFNRSISFYWSMTMCRLCFNIILEKREMPLSLYRFVSFQNLFFINFISILD